MERFVCAVSGERLKEAILVWSCWRELQSIAMQRVRQSFLLARDRERSNGGLCPLLSSFCLLAQTEKDPLYLAAITCHNI